MNTQVSSRVRMLGNLIYRQLYTSSPVKRYIINLFHRIYYESTDQTWGNTFFLGVPTQKCPLDLWIYQEIIFELKPNIIIECGTANGGSALFLASILDIIDNGRVITIDIKDAENRPKNKRIEYLIGSSTSEEIVEQVGKLIGYKDKVMVILDSDHHKDHVLKELRLYNRLVTEGSYLIVEDTNINGHPVLPNFGPGPMEAVEIFLKESKYFIVDKDKEKFYLTQNPNGYLRRVK